MPWSVLLRPPPGRTSSLLRRQAGQPPSAGLPRPAAPHAGDPLAAPPRRGAPCPALPPRPRPRCRQSSSGPHVAAGLLVDLQSTRHR
ncbi:hypothetical protein SEVIR_3G002166v4 [Setaria viridis]